MGCVFGLAASVLSCSHLTASHRRLYDVFRAIMTSIAIHLLGAFASASRSRIAATLSPPIFFFSRLPHPRSSPSPSPEHVVLQLHRRWQSSSSTTTAPHESSSTMSTEEYSPQIEAPSSPSGPQQLGKIEPRLSAVSLLKWQNTKVWSYRSMTFTCTANRCGHRSTHEFSRRSYQKGIVLVQCPNCKNRYVHVTS